MKVLYVVTGVVDGVPDGDRWEEGPGARLSFVTEPSGVLCIFRRPNDLWAAYAPGAWRRVEECWEES
jgi:hypothetical protein